MDEPFDQFYVDLVTNNAQICVNRDERQEYKTTKTTRMAGLANDETKKRLLAKAPFPS